jgi:hypothetical protein
MVTMLLLFREGDEEQSFANRADRREFFSFSETMCDPPLRSLRDGGRESNRKSEERGTSILLMARPTGVTRLSAATA